MKNVRKHIEAYYINIIKLGNVTEFVIIFNRHDFSMDQMRMKLFYSFRKN